MMNVLLLLEWVLPDWVFQYLHFNEIAIGFIMKLRKAISIWRNDYENFCAKGRWWSRGYRIAFAKECNSTLSKYVKWTNGKEWTISRDLLYCFYWLSSESYFVVFALLMDLLKYDWLLIEKELNIIQILYKL